MERIKGNNSGRKHLVSSNCLGMPQNGMSRHCHILKAAHSKTTGPLPLHQGSQRILRFLFPASYLCAPREANAEQRSPWRPSSSERVKEGSSHPTGGAGRTDPLDRGAGRYSQEQTGSQARPPDSLKLCDEKGEGQRIPSAQRQQGSYQ